GGQAKLVDPPNGFFRALRGRDDEAERHGVHAGWGALWSSGSEGIGKCSGGQQCSGCRGGGEEIASAHGFSGRELDGSFIASWRGNVQLRQAGNVANYAAAMRS